MMYKYKQMVPTFLNSVRFGRLKKQRKKVGVGGRRQKAHYYGELDPCTRRRME